MNTIVFNKLGGAVLFEDRGIPDRDRGSRPFGGVLDNPHTGPEMGIPGGPSLKDNLSLRHRRTGYAHARGAYRRIRKGRGGQNWVGEVQEDRSPQLPGFTASKLGGLIP